MSRNLRRTRRRPRRDWYTAGGGRRVSSNDVQSFKVPKYQLIKPGDTTRFRIAMSWFMQTFEALFTHLVDGPEEKIRVTQRKRKLWTPKRVCLETIGGKSFQTATFYTGALELDLLFNNLVNEKVVKPFKTIRSGYLDDEYSVKKNRYVERTIGLFMDDEDEEVTLTQRFAVYKSTKPKCVLFRKREADDTMRIALFAQKEVLDDAVKWFSRIRREYSPFRGRAVILAMDGMNVTSKYRKVGWEDLVPRKNIQDEFELLIKALTAPKEFENRGLAVKRGVLFSGPPGTGKTLHTDILITTAIKNKVPVFIVRGLPQGYTLGMLYKQAQDLGPSLVILEDIDTVAKDREEPYPTGSMSVLQELLNVLDGTEVIDRVVTVATTNMVDRLDRALAARPGRFDASYKFGYPGREDRIAVYKLHAKELKVNLPAARAFATTEGKELLEKEGITHSHIHGILNTMAKTRAARNGQGKLIDLFKEAVQSGENLVNPDPKYQDMIPQMGFGRE